MSLLETYVRSWRDTADSILALAADLHDDEWDAPT